VTRPRLLLADEPTGNLDSRTSLEIMDVFQRLNRDGLSILMVTHEPTWRASPAARSCSATAASG
jgi:putative ABC transport system ATP-binding protein